MIYPSILYDNIASNLATQYSEVPPFVLVADVKLTSPLKLNPVKQVVSLIGQPAYARSGIVVLGVNDQLYNRIVFSNDVFDMGALVDIQVRTLDMWNGYRVSKPVESLVAANADGLAIAQPKSPPFDLAPYESLRYTLSVSLDGPPAINGSFKWTIDGREYVVIIIGRRVMLLDVPVNWGSAFSEGLEWKTNVLRSYSGKEQRRALRDHARRSFEYDFLLQGTAAQRFRNNLWGWQNRTYALPIATDRSRLTETVNTGATVLQLDTTNRSFGDVSLLMITDGVNSEMCEITAITASTVTIGSGLIDTWLDGAAIYPLALVKLDEEITFRQMTDGVLTGQLTATGIPGSVGPNMTAGTAPTIYDGYEVITNHPNWSGGIDFTSSFDSITLDNQTGVCDYDTRESTARFGRQHSWLLKNKTEIQAFRNMLCRLKGQFGLVYVPSWTNDFIVARTHGALETALTYKANGFKLLVGLDTSNDRIMIRWKDGTTAFRKILAVSTDDDGNEVLSLGDTFDKIVSPDTIAGIYLMKLSRLATDKVTIEWRGDSVALSTLTFISVPS